MRNFYRLILGKKSAFAAECFAGNYVGVDFGVNEDLSKKLPDEWRKFNQEYIPVIMKQSPGKTKIGAGLAAGALWTVSKGVQKGDILLCADGAGSYRVAEVMGDYYFAKGENLPHRRKVHWFDIVISRNDMSEPLRNSAGSIGTVVGPSAITQYRDELEKLIQGKAAPQITTNDTTIEDPHTFALEKHLEDFLVTNWSQTDLGKEYDIYEDEGEIVGQQYETDTGPMDILAISKDKKTLLVIELKRGRASDVVVGQVLRYMGYVQDELSEKNQKVRGLIIAMDDDQKIKRALSAVPNIDFYRYQVSFKLVRG